MSHHLAPRLHHQAVALSAPTVAVHAALRGGHHNGKVFNGPGAQQHAPVRLAGGVGKRAGHQRQIGALLGVSAVQRCKTRVAAAAQADVPGVAVA